MVVSGEREAVCELDMVSVIPEVLPVHLSIAVHFLGSWTAVIATIADKFRPHEWDCSESYVWIILVVT